MAISKKNAGSKMTRIDRQIFRVGQFRHRNPTRRSTGIAPPFDYLAPHETDVIEAVFRNFDLEINDPAQRDYLLALLIYGIFGREGEPRDGRPLGSKTWNKTAKQKMRDQINGVIKSISEETGAMPKSMKAIRDRLIEDFGKHWNVDKDHLYNRVRELYRLQENKNK